ncbi:MAG: IS3 family transposase [Fastidiosipilaceae bacterium]
MKLRTEFDTNQNYTLEAFMAYLDNCLHWYNEKRIKLAFGCSILEHRVKVAA